MKVIETTDLTKYYGTARGIIDVNLSVNEGDFFGFIGPNGAGKSTTIRTLLGFISPTSGSAKLFGKDITGNKIDILSDIGYLPSEAAFYNGMKVKEIIELSAKLRKRDCSAEAKRLCERFELDTSRKVNELSLGNRKKVGIVCALQHEPKLYILDEPTSGLDPLMQREFYTIMKERNEQGATVFLSSHILSEVERYCKTASVIREGRIIVTDNVDALSNTGVKHVTLKGIETIPDFQNIKNVKHGNGTLEFLYNGSPSAMIKELAKYDFEDILISEPDFEETFMHYYAKEENQK